MRKFHQKSKFPICPFLSCWVRIHADRFLSEISIVQQIWTNARLKRHNDGLNMTAAKTFFTILLSIFLQWEERFKAAELASSYVTSRISLTSVLRKLLIDSVLESDHSFVFIMTQQRRRFTIKFTVACLMSCRENHHKRAITARNYQFNTFSHYKSISVIRPTHCKH